MKDLRKTIQEALFRGDNQDVDSDYTVEQGRVINIDSGGKENIVFHCEPHKFLIVWCDDFTFTIDNSFIKNISRLLAISKTNNVVVGASDLVFEIDKNTYFNNMNIFAHLCSDITFTTNTPNKLQVSDLNLFGSKKLFKYSNDVEKLVKDYIYVKNHDSNLEFCECGSLELKNCNIDGFEYIKCIDCVLPHLKNSKLAGNLIKFELSDFFDDDIYFPDTSKISLDAYLKRINYDNSQMRCGYLDVSQKGNYKKTISISPKNHKFLI